MGSTRRVAALAIAFITGAVASVTAQDEAELKGYFEGHTVVVRIDMPGTQEGVDVFPSRPVKIDLGDYRNGLKNYGTAIHAGDSAVVTLVKVKKDLIEFQLGGGGFGTFGDDTSTSVYIPLVEKSDREKDLEKALKKEDDDRARRRMEHELDELRDRRERENHRIMEERDRQSAIKAETLAENRRRGGSRFNIRFDRAVPAGFTPQQLIAALNEYVEFESLDASFRPAEVLPALPPPSPDITALRKGMSRTDVEAMLGRPSQVTDRRDGSMIVTTAIFFSGDQRIATDFVEGVLVKYAITSR